jgi:K+-transporting ATPase ATPase C chain
MDRIGETITTLRGTGAEGSLPADAVTASGSGLDPDISPAYAALQIARVAAARSLPVETVDQLVATNTETPFLGFFGEPRVNVLKLNLALDAIVAPGG